MKLTVCNFSNTFVALRQNRQSINAENTVQSTWLTYSYVRITLLLYLCTVHYFANPIPLRALAAMKLCTPLSYFLNYATQCRSIRNRCKDSLTVSIKDLKHTWNIRLINTINKQTANIYKRLHAYTWYIWHPHLVITPRICLILSYAMHRFYSMRPSSLAGFIMNTSNEFSMRQRRPLATRFLFVSLSLFGGSGPPNRICFRQLG